MNVSLKHVLLGLILFTIPKIAIGQDAQNNDLGTKVQKIFVAKCAECHGLKLRKPKGSFGFAEDLDRVRKEYSTSKDLEESDIWYYVAEADGDELMPPPKAKSGKLTESQLATIKKWVLAGAPSPQKIVPKVDSQKVTPKEEPEKQTQNEIKPEPQEPQSDEIEVVSENPLNVWRLIGAFHPVTVHFPIALILIACLFEWMRSKDDRQWRAPLRLLLLLVVITSIFAGVSGFQAQDFEGHSDDSVWYHKWAAIVGSCCAALSLILTSNRGQELTGRRLLFLRVFLVLGALLIGYAGHEGGLLVFGMDHFT